MAAFSHLQSHSLLLHPSSPSLLSPSLDPPLINNTPQLPHLTYVSSDLNNMYQNSSLTFSDDFQPSVARIHDASMVVNGDKNVARKDNNWRNCRNEFSSDQLPPFRRISSNPNNSHQTSNMTFSDDFKPSVSKTPSSDTSMVVNGQHDVVRKDKKRRNGRNGSPSKEPAEGRNKKQKKSDVGVVKEEEKPKEESKITKEPPAGYIHVRARRGQATDSHSLAERVRREKISERMTMLQRLVPGCDKVNGKALVLDEIINYVRSLQNQVEFLSMKLASVDPMFNDFTNELNTLMLRSGRLNSTSLPLPSVPQCSMDQDQVQAPNFGGDYLLDNSTSVFLQGHVSNTFSSEDDGSQFWDVEDQRQKFLTPYGFSDNLRSFH